MTVLLIAAQCAAERDAWRAAAIILAIFGALCFLLLLVDR